MTITDRFWSKVDVSGDCWEWTASKTADGYGHFRLDGKTVTAHRWVWEDLVGPIPAGLLITHLCRNPSCVNPDHLEPVTKLETFLRSGASLKAKSDYCPRGHRKSMYGGERRCRTCTLERNRLSGRRVRARESRRRIARYM